MQFQQSEATAAQRRVPIHLVDATDGITAETGITGTPDISKNGAAFAAAAAALTEIGNGAYYVELSAGNLDTLGFLMVRFKSAAVAEFQYPVQIVPWDPYDAVRQGMTALPNAAAEAAGGLYTRGAGAGQINQNANGQVDTRTVAMSAGVVDAAAIATNAIDADAIADNAIDAGAIAADAITAAKIANGAIDAATFAAGAIDAAAIANGAIDAATFAAGAIDAAAIANGAIDAATFAAGAIDAAAIADGAIDAATFAAGAINAAAIAADAIGASELAADAVTEIQAGLATAAALATVQADTDNIQTRLPAALVGGRMDANVSAINGATGGVTAFDRSTRAIVEGTVGAASTTTNIITSSLAPAATVADQFKGRIVIFDEDTTTANLRGQASDITANTALGVLTVTALTTAPVSGDTFVIL